MLRNQSESPLLRLPPELRNKIYKYALSFDRVYFTLNPAGYRLFYQEDPAHNDPERGTEEILTALTRACRQLRHEAAPLFFSCNEFSMVAVDVPYFVRLIGGANAGLVEAINLSDNYDNVRESPAGGAINVQLMPSLRRALKDLNEMKGQKRVRIEWITSMNRGRVNQAFRQAIKAELAQAEHLQMETPALAGPSNDQR